MFIYIYIYLYIYIYNEGLTLTGSPLRSEPYYTCIDTYIYIRSIYNNNKGRTLMGSWVG